MALTTSEPFIGVLALQGGVDPHLNVLARLGLRARPVRSAAEIHAAAGLVLPGGESTAQRKLLEQAGVGAALDAFARSGRPVLATCAGLVLCATRGHLDAEVERNAYGAQLHSFEAALDDGEHHMLFIRAPAIRKLGGEVLVLATLRGEPVVVAQANVIATSGHPELLGDGWLHVHSFARTDATHGARA
jgi:5'-phosphate synthase pdxT subunit